MRRWLKPVLWWGAWLAADVLVAVGQGLIDAALERKRRSTRRPRRAAKPKRQP